MKLTLIRHGATPGNAEKRYMGKTDEPLSVAGMEELYRLKAAGRYPSKPEMMFSSPLQRCLQTAELLYGDGSSGVTESKTRIHSIQDFAEMDFGEFEGMNYRELNGNPQYQAWIDSGGIIAFPGGEDRNTFISRCSRGMQELYAVAAGRSAVAVVHGGTIMALLSAFAGGDYWSYQTENGLGWTMQVTGTGDNLLFTNVEKL